MIRLEGVSGLKSFGHGEPGKGWENEKGFQIVVSCFRDNLFCADIHLLGAVVLEVALAVLIVKW